MVRFELRQLVSFDDNSLLNEIRRVSTLVEGKILTRSLFDEHSKVHSSTICKRFGGWKPALDRAGVGGQYGGRTVSEKMKKQKAKKSSDSELIAELQSVARKLGRDTITTEEFQAHSDMSTAVLRRRFGSWNKALKRADLFPCSRGRRYTEDEYFENLLSVWTHYGRQPYSREMDVEPSTIPFGAYEAKWGTWKRALLAFIDKANADVADSDESHGSKSMGLSPNHNSATLPPSNQIATEERRKIPLGLRYSVLTRDRFRCKLCGSSPATDISCQLHVDHIVPFSKDGKTTIDNLRTLCSNCNVGKSDILEEPG
jgi:hypothetical protein